MDTQSRDSGLSRISLVTRWSIAGAIGLSGLFTMLAARARPGAAKHPSTATPSNTVPSNAASSNVLPSNTAPSDSTFVPPLQAPSQLPSAGDGVGQVTSGAS